MQINFLSTTFDILHGLFFKSLSTPDQFVLNATLISKSESKFSKGIFLAVTQKCEI